VPNFASVLHRKGLKSAGLECCESCSRKN